MRLTPAISLMYSAFSVCLVSAFGYLPAGAMESLPQQTAAPPNSQAASPAKSQAASPANSQAASPAAPRQITAQIAEDDLKLELRNIHESLRRVESAAAEINNEANRRQMVNAPEMYGAMDPWAASNYVNSMVTGSSEMVAGAYLAPRVSYLKQSCDTLGGAFTQLQASIDKLPQLSANSNAFTGKTEASRARVDVQILQDNSKQLSGKILKLKSVCAAEAPTNADVLGAVQDFSAILKGMNETARRLWKDETPRHH